jgi:hypothetical protein
MNNKSSNKILNAASKAKKDEFYTQLVDVENELRHYKELFIGKKVYCNCDDPSESAFFHYFFYNFKTLGLKKLTTTCYKSKNRDLFSVNDSEEAICLEFNGYENNIPSKDSIVVKYLKGDGDFRSEECIELLKDSDIVVTNPPFSLFTEYILQLIKYDKQFLVIGNQNAITYKELFPHFMNNKIWLGYGFKRNCAHFINKHYTNYATDLDQKDGMIRVSGVVWYTNLDVKKRNESIILYKSYCPSEYPKYDNYDAIEVSKVSEIPMDYKEPMGVPVTFFNKYNPEQFEILGNLGSYGVDGYSLASSIYLNGKKVFKRILIKNKTI